MRSDKRHPGREGRGGAETTRPDPLPFHAQPPPPPSRLRPTRLAYLLHRRMKLCYPQRHVPPAIKPGRPIRHRHFSASPRSPGGLYAVSWPWLGCGRVSDSATAVVPDSVCRVGVGHHCAAERDFSTTKALSLRRGSDIAAAIPMAAIARRVGTAREASPVRRPPTLLPFHLAACAHNERKGDTPRPLGPGFNLRLGGQGHSFFVYSSRRRLMQSCMCTGAAQRRRLRRPIMIMTDKAGAFTPLVSSHMRIRRKRAAVST